MNVNVNTYLYRIRRRPDKHFLQLMETLHKVEDEAQQEKMLVGIFGPDGSELLPVVQEWDVGTKELIEMDIGVTLGFRETFRKAIAGLSIIALLVIAYGLFSGNLVWA